MGCIGSCFKHYLLPATNDRRRLIDRSQFVRHGHGHDVAGAALDEAVAPDHGVGGRPGEAEAP